MNYIILHCFPYGIFRLLLFIVNSTVETRHVNANELHFKEQSDIVDSQIDLFFPDENM